MDRILLLIYTGQCQSEGGQHTENLKLFMQGYEKLEYIAVLLTEITWIA